MRDSQWTEMRRTSCLLADWISYARWLCLTIDDPQGEECRSVNLLRLLASRLIQGTDGLAASRRQGQAVSGDPVLCWRCTLAPRVLLALMGVETTKGLR